MLSFKCEQCGKCCEFGDAFLRHAIRSSDVEKWKALGRNDILKYICPCCNRLVDPDQNNAPWKEDKCPFLEYSDGKGGKGGKARCSIHEIKPEACKEFPIIKCNEPGCKEKFHLHCWLWNGNCEGAKNFKIDLVQAVESQIKI